MNRRYLKPWQVYALCALSVASGVLGLLIFEERINPFVGTLLCASLPFFGAMVAGAK